MRGEGGGGLAWRGGCAWRRGVCMAKGVCVAGEMATAADGTHATGMHSCILILTKNIGLYSMFEKRCHQCFPFCVVSP